MIRLSLDTEPVHIWADREFGKQEDWSARIVRAMREVTELEDAWIRDGAFVSDEVVPKVIDEAADVVISLLADNAVHDRVIEKNRINQLERKWRPNGDGTGQHIKDTEA